MKRIIYTLCLLCLIGSVSVFAGGSQEASEDQGYNYTDLTGREVALPSEPERIVVSYLPLWESLIMLGIQPVAAGGAENYIATWPPFQGLDMEGIVDAGSSELNLELVTEMEPDLILYQVYDINDVDVANLELISPVAVFGPQTKFDWRLSLREVGKVVNREEEAEQAIEEVDAVLSSAREEFASHIQDESVLLISMMGKDRLYYTYRPELYSSEEGLGLQTPEGFVNTPETYTPLPLEQLALMDPDFLFVNVFVGSEGIYEELSANPVWQNLTAVKNDHVFVIPGPGHAISPMATQYTVNFIIDALR